MRVPPELQEGIRERLRSTPQEELRRAAFRLSEAYRGDSGVPALRSGAEQMAYLAVRLPATYGAVRSALAETAECIEDFRPETVLDLGSGPGTALWAAADAFSSVRQMVAVERLAEMAAIGKELARGSNHPAMEETEWHAADLRSWGTAEKYDLVVASYSIGELAAQERENLVAKAWACCAGALVLLEPGTRKGFEAIVQARRQLLGLGAELAAPCPHGLECPMKAAGDWCHFSARVERTAEHRRLKGGELGYEDEKFSYVVATRLPVRRPATRIVRHPMRHSGYTKLQLCTPEGLQERTVTRSQKEMYRKVKRADWGSGWE